MKRASITPAGLNVKKITAYLKGQAKNRNAVRITCQGGSVYIFTGYAAFKLPAVLYPEVIQPVTMQAAPADGVTIVFNTYDIAPYSAGEQTFFIPYDLVKPYLNDYGLHLLELDT